MLWPNVWAGKSKQKIWFTWLWSYDLHECHFGNILKAVKIQDSRFKCIYSDINVHVQRPFMIACMGATLEIIHRLKNKDIHDIIIIIYIQVYKGTIEHF